MNFAYYIPILMLFLIVFILMRKQRQMKLRQIIKKRKIENKKQMVEFAKRFIDKECLIYSFSGDRIECIIKEVTDSAILVESNGSIEAVNLDFIVRIREYPKNKKGNKKSIVLD